VAQDFTPSANQAKVSLWHRRAKRLSPGLRSLNGSEWPFHQEEEEEEMPAQPKRLNKKRSLLGETEGSTVSPAGTRGRAPLREAQQK
jgi:hypothetical protein